MATPPRGSHAEEQRGSRPRVFPWFLGFPMVFVFCFLGVFPSREVFWEATFSKKTDVIHKKEDVKKHHRSKTTVNSANLEQ